MSRVISSSPGRLEPIFQAMLENATRLCEASFGNMLLCEAGLLRRVALHDTPLKYKEYNEKQPFLDPEKLPSPWSALYGPSDQSSWSIWPSQNLTCRFTTLAGPVLFLLYQCSRTMF